jgi:hypothetical protein
VTAAPVEDAATEPTEEASVDAQPEAEPEAATNQDAEPDSADAADAALKKCPIEVDLTKYAPCMCYDILVNSPAEALPNCEGVVKCCPLNGGELKCE